MDALVALTLVLLTLFPVVHTAATWAQAQAAAPRGAYLHIPFCRRRCFYCDFPVKVVGDRVSTQRRETEAYVALLLREVTAAAAQSNDLHPSAAPPEPLDTVYFGGGTPSLLAPAQVEALLSQLDGTFGLARDCEVTLEMDPGTFDLPALRAFQRAGVTRVSMGVQSFSDATLRACGRAHSAHEALLAVQHLHAAGLENFSIDLISSLPGVDLPAWRDTLDQAVATGCAHVSVYDLQVEDRTLTLNLPLTLTLTFTLTLTLPLTLT